ncbi:unnamed protein product [Microthlaspi erraticum]|uniref:Reverse transcriptase zinc-binding domain-containing protein n=1 Tax=Microthlaspi erraticum TaxID=1685480 RepID=A0A6D2L775_9BRAS|nr:unnamed protein product [Microthlaspi erraticum]
MSCITSVKGLTLCLPTSKEVYPTVFHSLVVLKLCTCQAEWLNLLLCMLRGCPNLQSLRFFQCHNPHASKPRPCWKEPSSVPWFLLSSLKILTWANYEGREDEKQVAAFILRSAIFFKEGDYLLQSNRPQGETRDDQGIVILAQALTYMSAHICLKLSLDLFSKSTNTWVNSGSSALFWHEDLTNLGPLIELTGANGPRVTGIHKLATVNQVCVGGRHPILRLLRDCLPPELPTALNSDQDVYLWKNSLDSDPGEFSTAGTWNFLHPSPPSLPWASSVWFKDGISKHSFILWVIMRGRLVTRDRLLSWGLSVPSNCLLCNSSPETANHVLTECGFSEEIWRRLFHHHTFSLPGSLMEIVLWCRSASGNSKVNTISLLLVQAIVYCLWKERNARLHTSTAKTADVIIKEIHLLLRAKLFGLDRETSSQSRPVGSSSSSQQTSFLSTWFTFFQV